MKALELERLHEISKLRNFTYETPDEVVEDNLRTVTTKIAKTFAIDIDSAFKLLSDPQEHAKYFEVIKSTTPLIPLAGVLKPNQFYVFEHVKEERLDPIMMLIRYTIEAPNRIIKETIADPFGGLDPITDRKKGTVTIDFKDLGDNLTEIACESTFVTVDGPLFIRGFIDHVWFNFYERLMVKTGELANSEMYTG